MPIVSSKSGNTDVLIPSIPHHYQWYFRGDGGAIVDERLGNDLTEALTSGKWQEAIVAHKLEMVFMRPNRPDYRAIRRMNLGDFYVNEPFLEIWLIPVKIWQYNFKEKRYEEPVSPPAIIRSFLVRGHSIDEFMQLIKPVEEQSFLDWTINKKELSKTYKDAAEYQACKVREALLGSIYVAEVVKNTKAKKKDYYYLTWNQREPENAAERELIEIGNTISNEHPMALMNEIYERAAREALKSTAPAVGALPGNSSTNELPVAS